MLLKKYYLHSFILLGLVAFSKSDAEITLPKFYTMQLLNSLKPSQKNVNKLKTALAWNELILLAPLHISKAIYDVYKPVFNEAKIAATQGNWKDKIKSGLNFAIKLTPIALAGFVAYKCAMQPDSIIAETTKSTLSTAFVWWKNIWASEFYLAEKAFNLGAHGAKAFGKGATIFGNYLKSPSIPAQQVVN